MSPLRVAHRITSALLVAGALFLALRPAPWGSHDPISTGVVADLGLLAIGVTLALACWRMASGSAHTLTRIIVYLFVVMYAGMVLSRLAITARDASATAFWPPKPEPARAVRVDDLLPRDAAEWALRLTLHAAGGNSTVTVPTIPADWPFPLHAVIALRRTAEGGSEFWSRAGTAASPLYCRAQVDGLRDKVASVALTPRCNGEAPPTDLQFSPPVRDHDSVSAVSAAVAGASWPQHRLDSERSAAGGDRAPPSAIAGWHGDSHTEIRAGASAVGNLLLVGGHNTGVVVAFDATSGEKRWTTRAPNWVHQDVISDGRIGIVGFGDNERSFWGRAPSGVTAFDLTTGRRVWTKFDESSVMTSPVLVDSVLIYATAAGVLRKRLLATGALLAEQQLPGGVVMAPPVLRGDTIVVALEADQLCALLTADLRTLWCRQLRGQQMLGHASATIDAGVAIVSGVATPVGVSGREFFALPAGLQLRSLGAILFPRYWHEVWPGQRFTGVDLATGKVVWRSPLYQERRKITGQSAGTAAVSEGTGVIVLPLADTVVAFDTKRGTIHWTSGANEARGAPLVLEHQVVVAGRNGIIELRQLQDGALACTLRRKVGYDRAGPVVSGGLVIFANLEGEVEAIPARELLDCTATGAVRPGIAR